MLEHSLLECRIVHLLWLAKLKPSDLPKAIEQPTIEAVFACDLTLDAQPGGHSQENSRK